MRPQANLKAGMMRVAMVYSCERSFSRSDMHTPCVQHTSSWDGAHSMSLPMPTGIRTRTSVGFLASSGFVALASIYRPNIRHYSQHLHLDRINYQRGQNYYKNIFSKLFLRGNSFCNYYTNLLHLARKRSQKYSNNDCFREIFCNNFGQDGTIIN